jgi:hypothetical protein
MKTLMLHDIKPIYLNYDLKNYDLTFDDGLFSQFYYWPIIKKINTSKIFFICCDLISLENKVRPNFRNTFIEYPTCFQSMDKYKKLNIKSDYMTIDELKILSKDVMIGAHSFSHKKINMNDSFYNISQQIKQDTELMLEWFKKHLNLTPLHYCFPFNEKHYLHDLLLPYYGFKHFYGKERIDIESLDMGESE